MRVIDRDTHPSPENHLLMWAMRVATRSPAYPRSQHLQDVTRLWGSGPSIPEPALPVFGLRICHEGTLRPFQSTTRPIPGLRSLLLAVWSLRMAPGGIRKDWVVEGGHRSERRKLGDTLEGFH